MLHFGGEKPFFMKGIMIADEVTKFLGAQWPPRPNMALEAPRPLLGAGYYMKKLVAYLNNIQRKKLFCIKTLTKLPELTVYIC